MKFRSGEQVSATRKIPRSKRLSHPFPPTMVGALCYMIVHVAGTGPDNESSWWLVVSEWVFIFSFLTIFATLFTRHRYLLIALVTLHSFFLFESVLLLRRLWYLVARVPAEASIAGPKFVVIGLAFILGVVYFSAYATAILRALLLIHNEMRASNVRCDTDASDQSTDVVSSRE